MATVHRHELWKRDEQVLQETAEPGNQVGVARHEHVTQYTTQGEHIRIQTNWFGVCLQGVLGVHILADWYEDPQNLSVWYYSP